MRASLLFGGIQLHEFDYPFSTLGGGLLSLCFLSLSISLSSTQYFPPLQLCAPPKRALLLNNPLSPPIEKEDTPSLSVRISYMPRRFSYADADDTQVID